MTRLSIHLVRKYLATLPIVKPPKRNSVRPRHHKYAIVGISGGLAAVALQNVNNDDSIVISGTSLLRFFRTAKTALSISIDYYFGMMGLTEGKPNYDVMMSRIHERCAVRIRDRCLQNGGTYVKLGQGLVTLGHILPREYINTLKVLQDKCLPRDKEELYQVFMEDFGKKPEEFFSSFDVNPIAAASIAQVFKATTKDGQEVAVKVQYNDLRKRLSSDIKTVSFILTFAGRMHPEVDFKAILKDISTNLKQELDFVNEGNNGERCSKELSHLNYIHVPTVLWDYSSKRVLVTEFIDGIKISDIQRLKEQGFSLVEINNKLFEAFGNQIFQVGFVHADPHPGNILVRRRNGKAELVILDHGLYQELPNDQRIALSHMWKAIVLGNHDEMKKYAKILGVDDYITLAEILTQTPLRSLGFKLKVKLSKDDLDALKQMANERFDQLIACVQQMPKTLLLVLRNLNIIRSISYDHGCPIDRYAVLARMATKAAFEVEQPTFTKQVISNTNKLWFEITLLISRFVNFWRMLFLDALQKLGTVPDVKALVAENAKNL